LEAQQLISSEDIRIQNLEQVLIQVMNPPNFIPVDSIQEKLRFEHKNQVEERSDSLEGYGESDYCLKDGLDPQAIDIHFEIRTLQQILNQFQSEDQRKINNAIADAEYELQKPTPDKDEVGQALGRALDYAQKAEGFAESMDELRPHVTNAAGWLGKNWYKLLAIVGLAA
ncbi:MAG: hypothetical protein AAGB01_12535, partial [Cyanobacteria bacterium P01_F01_bin.42]